MLMLPHQPADRGGWTQSLISAARGFTLAAQPESAWHFRESVSHAHALNIEESDTR